MQRIARDRFKITNEVQVEVTRFRRFTMPAKLAALEPDDYSVHPKQQVLFGSGKTGRGLRVSVLPRLMRLKL